MKRSVLACTGLVALAALSPSLAACAGVESPTAEPQVACTNTTVEGKPGVITYTVSGLPSGIKTMVKVAGTDTVVVNSPVTNTCP